MQRTRHIRRSALITAAVMAAFILTYFAFAPEPLGPRAVTSPPSSAFSGVGEADAATPNEAIETAGGDAPAGAGIAPATTVVDPEPAAAKTSGDPDFTPEPGVNHWQRGRQLYWDRDYAAAAIELERATRQRPGSYYAHYLLGLCYQRVGDIDRAEREYIAAREIDGDQPEALVNLARLYLEMELAEEALELTVQSTEVTPEYAAGWNVRGRAHLALEQRDDAVAAFREACRLDEENAFAWNNLGYALLLGGDFEAALEPLETAVGIADDIAYMQNNLGVVLEQLGRVSEAHAAFVRAAELDPTHERAAASAERLAAIIETLPAPAMVESQEPVATTASTTLD